MPTPNFEKVWADGKTLTPDEMRRVRNLLDVLLAKQGQPLTKEDQLSQLLLRDGVIYGIPERPTDSTGFDNWKPIEVRGKPVSETLIEERR